MFTTREGLRRLLQEISTWGAAAFIGLAMIMSITVVFLPLGMWLIAAGVAVFTVGWFLSWAIPCLWRYKSVTCPYCRQVNQVRFGIRQFFCSGCSSTVKMRMSKGKEKNVVTLLLPANKKVV